LSFAVHPKTDALLKKPFGLFWASYMNGPIDKSMYFLSNSSTIEKPRWQQFCTQYHNHDSTVRWHNDPFRWTNIDNLLNQTLFFSFSKIAYSQPFFYGRFENMVWIVMFENTKGIRFAHSPSGGGSNQNGDDTNPAWDFQLVLPEMQQNEEFVLNFRAVYKQWNGRQDVLTEFRKFNQQ
jgi:hypothetical protein